MFDDLHTTKTLGWVAGPIRDPKGLNGGDETYNNDCISRDTVTLI
jgi:hypothetical protein